MIHKIIGKQCLAPAPGYSGSGGLGRGFAPPRIRPGSSHPGRFLADNFGQTRLGAPVARCSFVPEDVVARPGQRRGEDARRSTGWCFRVGPAAASWAGRQLALDGEISGTSSAGQG